MTEIFTLPNNFIGREDEKRLESLGAHLISHGYATRWHWSREHGVDVTFEIFRGGADESLLASIGRDRENDVFYAQDYFGDIIDEGSLDHVMAVVDRMARSDFQYTPA